VAIPAESVSPRAHATFPDGSLIVRTAQVPWTPWALPGTWFKLLDYDHNHSYTVILLRIDPDAPPVTHKHLGAANAYILSGGFGYEHGSVYEGDYMVEAGGVTHTPHAHPEGCVLLGFMHGVVQGVNSDGSIAGVVDVDWYIEAAKRNGAFAHLEHVRRS
jgi:anti-sigma factor ChrR (cupin superfamily)